MELPNLRKARELRGLSRAELAEKAGIGPRSIASYETGEASARPKNARAVADALDVPIWWLAGEEEPNIPKAPPPDSSHLNDGDRRFLDGLDGLCDFLDRKLRAGQLTPAEIEHERAVNGALAPLLARAMHEEADRLRKLHPEADDVGPWAVVGPRVARYTTLIMQVIDAGELDREREEAYRQAS